MNISAKESEAIQQGTLRYHNVFINRNGEIRRGVRGAFVFTLPNGKERQVATLLAAKKAIDAYWESAE